MKYLKTFEQFIAEKYPTVNEEEIEIKSDDEHVDESVNEGFEWWQPLLAIGASIGMMSAIIVGIFGPGWIVSPGAIASGDSWGDVVRHYKKKFKDKQAAKMLTKEDVLELINLIQTNIDKGDLGSGVSRYMKGLMNKLEKELNKGEDEVDKNKLLFLLRDVEKYARRKKVKLPSDIKESINESVNEKYDNNTLYNYQNAVRARLSDIHGERNGDKLFSEVEKKQWDELEKAWKENVPAEEFAKKIK
jgi:hypothetical protein